MDQATTTETVLRRAVLRAAGCGGLALAAGALASRSGRATEPAPDPAAPHPAMAEDTTAEDDALITRLLGRSATDSPRVRLQMPAVFGNGYSVPLTLSVDSPMTDADHVRLLHVLAPRNPIVLVARLRLTPQSGRAAVTTRIRLAKPQTVLAVAEMNDDTLLLARRWVEVATNGCA